MMRGESVVLCGWVAVCAAVAACGPAIAPLPSQGGPPWIELTSPHFTVWTDSSGERARELISEMEQLRQALAGTAFQSIASDGNILVIAVRDLYEYHAYDPDRFWGKAASASANVLHQPLIKLPARTPDFNERRLEAHELAHAISFGMAPRQPSWFAEGLAMFFQTVRIDAEHGTVEIGHPPESGGRPIWKDHLIDVPTLFACEQYSCMSQAFYATSWVVFTYLRNLHADQLARFEQLLIAKRAWREAWGEAFPQLSPAALHQEVQTWLAAGRYEMLRFDVPFRDYPVAQRTLDEADIHAIRGLLAPHEEELVEIAAARRLEPTHVLANLLSHFHDKPLDADTARAVAAAHPDDWRAWWLLANALRTGDAARQAAAKACQLTAPNPAIRLPDGLCARLAAATP